MKGRKLKPFVVPFLYLTSIAMLIGSIYCVEKLISNKAFASKNSNYQTEEDIYPSEEPSSSDVPVVSTDPTIMRPYTDGNIKVLRNFYDRNDDNSKQEESIVYYGNTYMQNSGIDYGMEASFDVVSILDGTVEEVTSDEIMGQTIKIKHNNDLISVYQSLESTLVKKGEQVNQGMIIGKSGTADVSSDLGNHLHFELYHQGHVVNPDNYYDKTLGSLS